MFGMSNEQIMALIRQILPVIGGIAVSFGWFSVGQVEGITNTILQIAGPALIVISTIWALVSRTKTSMVAAVAALPEVKEIKVEPTVEGTRLASATPPNVTVAR